MDLETGTLGAFIRIGKMLNGTFEGRGCVQCTDDMTVPILALVIVVAAVVYAVLDPGREHQ